MNLLSLSIALPLVGGVATGLIGNERAAKISALVFAGLELLLSLAVFGQFSADLDGFQLLERYPWIPTLNAHVELGIDGISILFLPITALLTFLAMLSTWNDATSQGQWALLLFEAAAVGMYTALDLLLFYTFWQAALPTVFFLIGLGGTSPTARTTASKCFLFMVAGGAPLLMAVLLLAVNHATQHIARLFPDQLSFSLLELLDTPLSDPLQGGVFLLMLAAFTVKAPLIPFHTWWPATAMDAPIPISALIVGLNLGCYGIIRFAIPLAPSAVIEYHWVVGMLGAVTFIYAALLALRQSNLRRFLAFACVSQAGLAVIGLASLNMQGIQGALLQLCNISLTGSCLFFIAGMLKQRLGSTEQCHLGGLASVMPRLAGFYLLFAAASVGLPFSTGFPAELLVILGGLTGHPSLGVIALAGAIIAVAYTVTMFRRAFLGSMAIGSAPHPLADIRRREFAILAIPALLVLLFGFWPNPLLEINKKSAENWLAQVLDQPGMEGEELAAVNPKWVKR